MKHASQLGLIIALAFVVGCANLETNAFRTIGMVQVSASAAIDGWRDYVATGKATKGDEDRARQLWTRYQEATVIAEKAQKAYSATKDVSQLQAAASVMAAAGGDLVEFVYGFIPSPTAKKGK